MKTTVSHLYLLLLTSIAFNVVHTQNDNDKCQWGVCDQKCVITANSYNCHCETGWTLQDDRRSCKPENGDALMVYSTGTSIQGYLLQSGKNFIIAENLHRVIAVSLDANYTYWSDNVEDTISRSLNDGTQREDIVTIGLDVPDDIAVDWITGNIYFTDITYKSIGVCSDNGYFCKVLINEDIHKPRGIAVVPSRGKMYWTDWGDNPHIGMSYMDGSKKEFFLQERLGWPNDLTIDDLHNRLYWVDAKLKTIECIKLDGSDRRILLEGVAKHPYSVALFGNRLYWSDWDTNNIHSCNKFTGKNVTNLLQLEERPFGIHIYHSNLNVKQPNPCALKPCSQLCLLAENQTYTCACTVGTEINKDRHTCRDLAKRKHIAIVAGNAIANYYLPVLGRPMSVISNVTNNYMITAATYDPLQDSLIGLTVDEVSHSIFRYDLESKQVNHIKSIADKGIECIAFDYFGNNLYMSINQKIQVLSLSTGEKIEFSYEESPLDMILVPERGIMFVVFRSDESLLIACEQMNGLNNSCVDIVQGLVGPKISLAYDKEANRIFWADEGTGRIESSNLNGQNRTLFRSGITSPVGIAVQDSEIYWMSRRSANLRWTAKKQVAWNTETFSIDIGQRADVALLQSVDGFYVRRLHPCNRNNGGCSHVCLVTDDKNRLCACPANVVLDSDMKTCKTKIPSKIPHADGINISCSNGHFWIGLFVGLLVFITFSVILYYIRIKKYNFTNMRNPFGAISIKRRHTNLASPSTTTIDTL